MAVVWRPQQARVSQVWVLEPQVWQEAWLVSWRRVLALAWLVWRRRARVAVLQAWSELRQALFLVLPEEWLAQRPVWFPLWPVLLDQG